MQQLSAADCFRALSSADQTTHLASLSTDAQAALLYDWEFWARPEQLPPEGDWWKTWLILAGRGWGKSRTGAEFIRAMMTGSSPLVAGSYGRVAIVGETSADARDVMVEGESGLLSVHPADFRPLYEPSKRRLTWPNGAVGTLYNATEPDQLRGPQHDLAWADEPAKWQYAQETWDQLQFGLRLGHNPRQVATTTPRPIPMIKRLIADPTTVTTRGRTMDNRANLAPSFIQAIHDRYAGTRLGRQELEAEILDDVPGALWTRDIIENTRIDEPPALARVIVAIDPSGTSGADEGDDIGIVVVGRGNDGRGYVLEDLTCKLSPDGWARLAVTAYHRHKADRIVAERNFGGAMVEAVIRNADRSVAYKELVASRGKSARAEPVSALYEQGRVSHIRNGEGLAALEDEMMLMTPHGFIGERSPNRVDALVWGLTEAMLSHQPAKTDTGAVAIPSIASGFARRAA